MKLGPIAPMLESTQNWSRLDEPRPGPDLTRCPTFWLEETAEKLFKQAFDELEVKSINAGSDEVEALWAKGAGQVLRFAAAIQTMRNHTGMELPSDDWCPPDHILSHSDFEQIASVYSGNSDALQHHIRTFYPRVSAETIKLALKLVIAGKTQGIDLVERANDPMQQKLRVFLDYVQKNTPKSPAAGVKLTKIAKNAWNSRNRPKRADINQLAQLAQGRGLIVFVENRTAVRSVR
jgi:hypothetical protein